MSIYDQVKDLIEKINYGNSSFDDQKRLIDVVYKDRDLYDYAFSHDGIISDNILDEIIEYAILKDICFMQVLPKDRFNYDLCYNAIHDYNGSPVSVLECIPESFMDSNFASMLVSKKTYFIKKIPTELVSREFVEKLKSDGINLDKYETYINQCYLLRDEGITHVEIESKGDYSNLNIDIGEFEYILTKTGVRYLKEKNINTIEQLFHLYDAGFISDVIPVNSSSYIEVLNSTKLLRCKFLGEDPKIDIKDSYDYDERRDLLLSMGVSTQSFNSLMRNWKFINDDIISQFKKDSIYTDLKKIRGLGEIGAIELINKFKILIEYNEKVKANNSEPSIEELNNRLNLLMSERARLDNEITNVIELIKKNSNVPNGGIKK